MELASDRLARERDYHNQRAVKEIREAQSKYYTAIQRGEHFEKAIARLSPGADILEYGCGSAPMLFDDHCRNARSLTGIDIAEVAIATAARQASLLGKSAHFETMDAEHMTFSDQAFDLVFGKGIIHHLDTEQSLAEISRVLRPGGTALFWEPLGHNFAMNLYRRVTPYARTADEHPLLRHDFAIAQRYFPKMELSFYGLTTLLSVPWRATKFGETILNITEPLDQYLFRIPGMRWQAWYVLIEMRKST